MHFWRQGSPYVFDCDGDMSGIYAGFRHVISGSKDHLGPKPSTHGKDYSEGDSPGFLLRALVVTQRASSQWESLG